MIWRKTLSAALAAAAAAGPGAPAAAQSVRLGGLEDVAFGTVVAIADQSRSQNVVVCSYRNNPHRVPYSVTAVGSGAGGAFALASGAAALPYDVQWADAPGQTGGTMLQAGVPSARFDNGATGFACPQQPDTASLTLTIRAADLATAQAGNYSGSLRITIAPQ